MSEPFCACDWSDECDSKCGCVCHELAVTADEEATT